jgi:hypothetical protein
VASCPASAGRPTRSNAYRASAGTPVSPESRSAEAASATNRPSQPVLLASSVRSWHWSFCTALPSTPPLPRWALTSASSRWCSGTSGTTVRGTTRFTVSDSPALYSVPDSGCSAPAGSTAYTWRLAGPAVEYPNVYRPEASVRVSPSGVRSQPKPLWYKRTVRPADTVPRSPKTVPATWRSIAPPRPGTGWSTARVPVDRPIWTVRSPPPAARLLGSAATNAFAVASSTTPVTGRFARCWNWRTAAVVLSPKEAEPCSVASMR